MEGLGENFGNCLCKKRVLNIAMEEMVVLHFFKTLQHFRQIKLTCTMVCTHMYNVHIHVSVLVLHDIIIQQKSELLYLGTYTAMSIVQDGKGFPILHPSIYNYIWSGKYIGGNVLDENIMNGCIRQLVLKVCLYTLLYIIMNIC